MLWLVKTLRLTIYVRGTVAQSVEPKVTTRIRLFPKNNKPPRDSVVTQEKPNYFRTNCDSVNYKATVESLY